MRVLLQFPEGLKQNAYEIAKRYEKEGHIVFISAKACYGACDLPIEEARTLKVDKIIHFGHNQFVKKNIGIEIEYIPWRIDIDTKKTAEIITNLEIKKIILATTVQHSHMMNELKALLEEKCISVLLDKGAIAFENAQILGCDAYAVERLLTSNTVNAIIYIGSGSFHPKALAYLKEEAFKKLPKVYSIDPYTFMVKDITEEIIRLRKIRMNAIAQACFVDKFAVVVSTKIGQRNIGLAEKAKRRLERLGKSAQILICDELSPESIRNFTDIQAIVNTACPRIADDQDKFGMPIINATDLQTFEKMLQSVR